MNRDHTPQPDIQTRDAVRFIYLRVTVYPAVDYGCRGPWMYAGVDGVGFRCRTEQTELILAPVLNANIYVIMTGPLVNIVVNGFLIIDSEKCRRSVLWTLLRVSVFFATFFDLLYSRYWI